MKLKLWQVDAFSARVFGGNPAAVVPLNAWLPDATLQAIANENNLAETAFIVREADGLYELRWFTPEVEVPLCGHATLASAWVIFERLEPHIDVIRFDTKSGELTVEKSADGMHRMSFPAGPTEPLSPLPLGLAQSLGDALGVNAPAGLHWAPRGAGGNPGLLAIWADHADVRAIAYSGALVPLLREMDAKGLLASAAGDGKPFDIVSRFFAPDLGVPEDPVTGSMHCTLVPFWADHLGTKRLRALQASARGGDILCTDEGARVTLAGHCALYLTGEIEI